MPRKSPCLPLSLHHRNDLLMEINKSFLSLNIWRQTIALIWKLELMTDVSWLNWNLSVGKFSQHWELYEIKIYSETSPPPILFYLLQLFSKQQYLASSKPDGWQWLVNKRTRSAITKCSSLLQPPKIAKMITFCHLQLGADIMSNLYNSFPAQIISATCSHFLAL